jgi:uncharacterized delta-60 repeat protein
MLKIKFNLRKVIVITICLIASNIYSQTVLVDENFGENGIVTIPNLGVEFLTFDKQGNIFALGYASFGFPTILKTNSDGVIDQHFGTGGTVMLQEYWSNLGRRYGIKITNENKILIIFSVIIHTFAGPDPPPKGVILRFNENGSIDESFGDNGEIILDNPSILAVNTENNDFLLIAYLESYYDETGYIQKSYVSKYNYNGEIDMNFGANGKAYLTGSQMRKFIPNSIKILKDQSIVLAGSDESSIPIKLAFCKLNPNGSFVTDFANNGIFSANIDNSPYAKNLLNVIETSNGNLLFDGNIVQSGGGRSSFLYGFNPNGTINVNFGTNGIFYYNDNSSNSQPTALQIGDKLLIGRDKKIVSIKNNGSLDTYFNNNGTFIFENFNINNMKLQSSNEIIVGGREGLVRLNTSDCLVCGELGHNCIYCEICEEWNCEKEICPNCNLHECDCVYCEICEDWDCEKEHVKCEICEDWDCEKEHVQCEVCGDWDCTENHETSILNRENNVLKIYPNPVKDLLQLECGELRINRVKILDLSGRVIQQFNNPSNQIKVSALSQGIYILKIETNNGILTKKFIKH